MVRLRRHRNPQAMRPANSKAPLSHTWGGAQPKMLAVRMRSLHSAGTVPRDTAAPAGRTPRLEGGAVPFNYHASLAIPPAKTEAECAPDQAHFHLVRRFVASGPAVASFESSTRPCSRAGSWKITAAVRRTRSAAVRPQTSGPDLTPNRSTRYMTTPARALPPKCCLSRGGHHELLEGVLVVEDLKVDFFRFGLLPLIQGV